MEHKSKLELIIGPMFSGKCLEENTLVPLFSGEVKKIKDINKGDYLVNHLGEPVKVINKNIGKGKIYNFIFKDETNNFSCTPNHRLVLFNKNYYYSKITEKRGLFYYFDNTYKMCSVPCLYKNIQKQFQILKNTKNILDENSMIIITAEEYKNLNRIYSKLTYFKKVPLNSNYIKRNYSYENFNFFIDIPDDIINNNINIKMDYIRQILIKNKSQWRYCNEKKFFYIFNDTTPEFKSKFIKLCKSLNIDISIVFNYIKLYITNEEIFSNTCISKKIELYEIDYNNYGNYIGLEVENELFCLYSGIITHNSTFISSIINKYSVINKNILVLSHILDKGRYSSKYISTHNGETKIPCYYTNDIYDFVQQNKDLYNKSKMIFIEECQFFKNLDKFIIEQLKITDKYFILCGLSGDINGKPFDIISNLIPHCDTLHKLSSFCKICNDGTSGIYTKLICKNKENEKKEDNYISIGADDKYLSVCRNHFY
jgi:thymidine kinase